MHTIRVWASDLQHIVGRTNDLGSLLKSAHIEKLIADNGGLEELLRRVELELCDLINRAQAEAAARNCGLDQIRVAGIGLIDSATAKKFTDPRPPRPYQHNMQNVKAHFASVTAGQGLRIKQCSIANELCLEFQRQHSLKPTIKTPVLAASGAP